MTHALNAGAYAQVFWMRDFTSWRSMDSAPRDGTFVELKCTYGVAPWYCIARWTDECIATTQDGGKHIFKVDRACWQKPGGGGPSDERYLHWRPYAGEISDYVDPTGGMQNDMAYWRGAIASKYNLPLDHFEAIAAKNAKRNQHRDPWWRRFLKGKRS